VIDLLPKIKIEVVLDDAIVERAVQAIQDSARTAKIGEGKTSCRRLNRLYASEPASKGPTRSDAALIGWRRTRKG
jgi:nitrogen regulatory protein P-II 1